MSKIKQFLSDPINNKIVRISKDNFDKVYKFNYTDEIYVVNKLSDMVGNPFLVVFDYTFQINLTQSDFHDGFDIVFRELMNNGDVESEFKNQFKDQLDTIKQYNVPEVIEHFSNIKDKFGISSDFTENIEYLRYFFKNLFFQDNANKIWLNDTFNDVAPLIELSDQIKNQIEEGDDEDDISDVLISVIENRFDYGQKINMEPQLKDMLSGVKDTYNFLNSRYAIHEPDLLCISFMSYIIDINKLIKPDEI